MIKEINLNYKGLDIIVTGDYIVGLVSYNNLDPPEEDQFWINELEVNKNAINIFLNMKNFIEERSSFNEYDIEQMCIDKCKE